MNGARSGVAAQTVPVGANVGPTGQGPSRAWCIGPGASAAKTSVPRRPPVRHANAVVVLEDLRPADDASAKGPLDQPGRNVAAKSGFNRAILAKGWHRFALALSSAARYTGRRCAVPAAYTSQRCSSCGHVDPKSRESQAVFRCTTLLPRAEHADVNAAKNILAAGLAVTACEESSAMSNAARVARYRPQSLNSRMTTG